MFLEESGLGDRLFTGGADDQFVKAFPQIILNGELVGGLDILKEMMESGEWDELYDADGDGEKEKAE